MEVTDLDRKNDQLCSDVAKMAAEHREMAQYIADALPFIKAAPEARKCSVYEDGQNLLKRVRSLTPR